MHKPVAESFIVFIENYRLHGTVCALLLYDWEGNRFVGTSISTNASGMLHSYVTTAMMSLADRNPL